MSNIEKISIALTPDMAAAVRQAVEGGGYASSSEVIREALRDWQTKQWVRQKQLEEIRRLVQEGLDSGPPVPWDVEAFKKEARRRFEAQKSEE